MKILVAIFSLVVSTAASSVDTLGTDESSLSLAFEKSVRMKNRNEFPPQICSSVENSKDLTVVKGSLKFDKELMTFKLFSSGSENFQATFSQPRALKTKKSSVDDFSCWKTRKIEDDLGERTTWISESTNKPDDFATLTCSGETCRFQEKKSYHHLSWKMEKKANQIVAFYWHQGTLMLVLQEDQNIQVQVLRLPNIAAYRRRLLQSAGDTITDLSGTVTISGRSPIVLTLKCGAATVTSCLKQCPGSPYSSFPNTNAIGVCTSCTDQGEIQWDDTMTCQFCNLDNNGITIGHFWNGATCQQCDPICKTCIGPSSGECIKCWDDSSIPYYWSFGLNVVSPPTGRRLLAVTNCAVQTPVRVDPNCDFGSNCGTCLDSNRSFCLTPKTGGPIYTLRQDHRPVECGDGFYLYQPIEEVPRVCGVCSEHCLRCSNSFTCLECDPAYPFYSAANRSCFVNCPTGYYPDNTPTPKVCLACNPSCLTCSGSSASHCTSCPNYGCLNPNVAGGSVGTCDTACPTGTYSDNYICQPCPANCASCGMSNYCSTCNSGSYLYQDYHCGPCTEPRMFINGNNCEPCSASCLTCSGSFDYQCTSCDTSLYYSSQYHTCTSCEGDGIYKVEGLPKRCEQCDSSCRTCTGPNNNECTSCYTMYSYGLNPTMAGTCIHCQQYDKRYIDSNGVCITCSASQYVTGSACVQCPTHCSQCDYMGYCTACDSGYYQDYMNMYNCVPCGAGHYVSGDYCYPCSDSNCISCTSSWSCAECSETYYLSGYNCYQCSAGQLYNSTAMQCQSCTSPCNTCSGGGYYCTSCQTNYRYDTGHPDRCVQCNSGETWTNDDGGTCHSCSVSNCDTCQTSTTCSVCISGFQIDETGQCQQCNSGDTWTNYNGGTCTPTSCSVSNCATCQTSTTCSICNSGYQVDGAGMCVQCATNQFWTGTACQDCDSACATCSGGPSNCQSCNSGFFYSGSNTCEPCDSSCWTCENSASYCTSCQSPYQQDGNSCSIVCSSNQYFPAGGASCVNCPDGCTTCDSDTVCTGCNQYHELTITGSCQRCIQHYYLSGPSCLECDGTCADCSGGSATDCLSCPSGSNYNSNAHTCTVCLSDFFWDSTAMQCQSCTSPCNTCSGSSTYCTSCDGILGLSNGACAACSPNEYFINNAEPCGTCTPHCTSCTSPSDCSSCDTNYELTITNTCSPCLTTQFWTSNPGTCTNCPQHCATCTSLSACSTCASGYYRYPNSLCGECDTDDGHYTSVDGLGRATCQDCLVNFCKRCPGGTPCLECQPGTNLMSNGQCEDCAVGEFYAPISKNCSPIQFCQNYDGTTCHQCDAGLFFDGSNCITCSSNCDACTDSSHCTQCSTNFHLRYQAGGNVDCDPCTADGWFKDNNKCYPCNSNCQACSGTATYCTKCQSPNMLVTDLHSCAASCPTTHFQVAVPQSDPVIYECQPCDSTRCSTCTGSAANCQTCKDPLQSPQSGVCCTMNCKDCQQGQCLSCRDGFFLDGSVCSACDSSCKTCDKSATHCTTCPVGKYLYADYTCGQCETAGLFVDGTSCSTCTRTCLTCKEKKDNCTSCTKNFTLTNGTCIVAEIPPGKISLVSATFQPSTISASLAFSETVAAIDESTVRAALYTASKESLALAMTASSPGDYLAQLGTPEKAISVSKVIATADTLRFDLVISGQVKNLVLVLAFGKLNAIESDSGSKATYSPHFAIVEKVSIISTSFDQNVAQIKTPATTAVSTATSTLMIASAPQAFILMKIFQSLDFYVFLDILLPANFVVFLDMMTSSILDIMPNFFDKLAVDDAASQKDKFSEFGIQVNIFSNLGPLFTTLLIALAIKLVIKAIAWTLSKSRQGKRSFMDSINETFGVEIFYGFVESNHLEIILSFLVFEAEQDRLELSIPAKVMTNAFVAVLMLAVLSVYVGMYWYVRKAVQNLKTTEEKSPSSAEKKEASQFEFLVSNNEMEKGNFFQRNFSLIQLLKDILFAGLLYIAYSSPIGILSVLTTAQIAFIVLVFKYRPFKEKRQNVQLMITQVIYGLLDITMLLLSFLPEDGTENIRYYGFGFMLIGLVLAIFLVSFGFAGYEGYLSIKKGIQYLRGKGKISQVSPTDTTSKEVSLNESNLILNEKQSISSKKMQNKNPETKIIKNDDNSEVRLENKEVESSKRLKRIRPTRKILTPSTNGQSSGKVDLKKSKRPTKTTG